MKPQTRLDLSVALAVIFLTITSVMGGALPAWLAIAVGGLAVIACMWHYWGPSFEDFLDSGGAWAAPSTDHGEFTGLDPWRMQRMLMIKSAQQTPQLPVLTKNGILYGVLIMEEAGETFAGLGTALAQYALSAGESYLDPSTPHFRAAFLGSRFSVMGATCQENARQLKDTLAHVPDYSITWELPEIVAREIFDGTTDIAVVNSGFALAFGFPAAEGYSEVARSNLSKANPETGVIDKEPSGKWIKNKASYVEPDLGRVLRKARAKVKEEQAHALASLGVEQP